MAETIKMTTETTETAEVYGPALLVTAPGGLKRRRRDSDGGSDSSNEGGAGADKAPQKKRVAKFSAKFLEGVLETHEVIRKKGGATVPLYALAEQAFQAAAAQARSRYENKDGVDEAYVTAMADKAGVTAIANAVTLFKAAREGSAGSTLATQAARYAECTGNIVGKAQAWKEGENEKAAAAAKKKAAAAKKKAAAAKKKFCERLALVIDNSALKPCDLPKGTLSDNAKTIMNDDTINTTTQAFSKYKGAAFMDWMTTLVMPTEAACKARMEMELDSESNSAAGD
jgi:hypothetical protein